jgi:hypothetical protein
MFKPTHYDLQAHHIGWVLKMREKAQERAYKIWIKRLSAIDDASLEQYPHGGRFDQLNRIWEELYCRCAAIKYPDMVKGVKWPETEDAWLNDAPRGSFIMRERGKPIAVHTGKDKLCINPDSLEYCLD